MKKIVYFIFVISLIFFTIMNFLDYSNNICDNFEKCTNEIEISKPDNLTNDQFINKLNNIFKDMNSDIIYLTNDNSQFKSHNKYYMTTNTDLIVFNKNQRETLNRNEVLSTYSKDDNHEIIGSSLFYNVSVYNFNEIEKYNLDTCKYYIDKSKSDYVIQTLSANGFMVKRINSETTSHKFISISNMFLPTFLFFISSLFYVISKRKEIVCKRLLGYSNFNVIIEDCIKDFFKLLGITALILSVNFIIIGTIYRHSFFDYFNFTYNKICIIIIYIILVLLTTNLFNIIRDYTSYLKGKNKNIDMYLITLVSKIAFCTLLIINLSSVSRGLISIYKLNKINTEISNKIQNYVALPVNVSSLYIGDGNEAELRERANDFYNDTVSQFNGVLIETRQYLGEDDNNSENNDIPEMEDYRKWITINNNYLKINPIHDINNNEITPDFFDNNKLNILICQNEDENKIKDIYSKRYKITTQNINIIKYLKDEKIYSFSPNAGEKTNGLICNPDILVYDSKYIQTKALSYISGKYYFLQIDDSNPYEIIEPVLKEHGLDSIIKEAHYISNLFSNKVSSIKQMLIISLINFVIYIIGMILMIVYSSKIFFTIYKKEICLKRVNGYNFLECYTVPLIIQLVQLIFFIVIRIKFYMNIYIVLITSLVELIIFIAYLKHIESKNIASILKGDN